MIYFSSEGPAGWELYRTNGNVVEIVADLNPEGDSLPRSFFVLGETIYFEATLPEGVFLHSLQGETLETLVAVDLVIGNTYGFTPDRSPFREYHSGVLFPGEGPNGVELFWTDGDELKEFDVLPGPESSLAGVQVIHGPSDPFLLFDSLIDFGDIVLFSAKGDQGFELFGLDGNSISQLTDFGNRRRFHAPSHFVKIGGRVFFTANGGIFQASLVGDYDEMDFSMRGILIC